MNIKEIIAKKRDGLELSKSMKQEIPNLKNYIENRNRLLSRNKTLTYKENTCII